MKLKNIIAGSIASLLLINCSHQISHTIINIPDNKVYSQIEYPPKVDYKKDKLEGVELAIIEYEGEQTRVSFYDMSDFRYIADMDQYFVYSYDLNNNNIADFKVFHKVTKKNKSRPENSKISETPIYGILMNEITNTPLKLYAKPLGDFTRHEILLKDWDAPPLLKKDRKVGKVTKQKILGEEFYCQDYDLDKNGDVDVMAFSETKKSNPKYLLIVNKDDDFMRLWVDIDLNGSFDRIVN